MTSSEQNQGLADALLARVVLPGEVDEAGIREVVAGRHAADVAEVIAEFSEEAVHAILDALETEDRAEVLSHMTGIDEHAVEEFVEESTARELAAVVREMDPDDAVDLLEVVDAAKAREILRHLDADAAAEVTRLRQFSPDSAGGIMTTEFLTAQPGETREEIVQHLRLEHDEVETVQRILVCEPNQRLLGLIRARDLLAAHAHVTAAEMMDTAVVSVVPTMDQEVCANLMQKYDLMILPVVDVKGRPIGIITHDDILDVVGDEAEEDMFRMVGVGDDRPLEHGPFERAFKRLPWLATTLIGMGLIGPLILHRWFQATLDEIVVLAFFIPAIMGLGGNTATQSSTITVRGLATEEIAFADLWWMIRRESMVALIIAVVCAVVIVFFSYGVAAAGLGGAEGSFSAGWLAATVGIAMFAGIMVSVLLGTSIPMLCHRAGFDPALAAGPFITTLIDISTQVIYLGLATWLLLA